MLKLLIVIENKILLDFNEDIPIKYNGNIDNLYNWCKERYKINIISKKQYKNTNIHIIYSYFINNHYLSNQLISFSKAISISTDKDIIECLEKIKKYTFYKDISNDTPFYIDIPIREEIIFLCDRRIWQGAIFDRFIYNRKKYGAKKIELNVNKIESWLINHQNDIEIDSELVPQKNFSDYFNNSSKLLRDVITTYIKCLYYLGFVSGVVNNHAVVQYPHEIKPPKVQNQKNMIKILETSYFIDIDRLLSHRDYSEYKTDNSNVIHNNNLTRKQQYKLGYLQVKKKRF